MGFALEVLIERFRGLKARRLLANSSSNGIYNLMFQDGGEPGTRARMSLKSGGRFDGRHESLLYQILGAVALGKMPQRYPEEVVTVLLD